MKNNSSKITPDISARMANMSFLCAILVVTIHLLGHPLEVGTFSWVIWFFISKCCACIAVPYFFLLSGFLLARHCQEDGWWRRAVVSRCRTLVVPFFIWCGLMLLCQIINGGASWQQMDFQGVLNALGFNPFTQPNNHPLWYVRALFLLVLVSPLLVFLIKRWAWCFLSGCLCIYLLVYPGTVNVYRLCNSQWTFFLRFFFLSTGAILFFVWHFLMLFKFVN